MSGVRVLCARLDVAEAMRDRLLAAAALRHTLRRAAGAASELDTVRYGGGGRAQCALDVV